MKTRSPTLHERMNRFEESLQTLKDQMVRGDFMPISGHNQFDLDKIKRLEAERNVFKHCAINRREHIVELEEKIEMYREQCKEQAAEILNYKHHEAPINEVHLLTYQATGQVQIQVAGVFSTHQRANEWLKDNPPTKVEVIRRYTYTVDKGVL